MTEFGVVLFATTSAALQAEKVLLRAGLDAKPIPTPRQFASDCGIALRFDWTQVEVVSSLLERAEVEHAGIRALA